MKAPFARRMLVISLLATWIFGGLAVPSEAAAQVTPANALIGLFRVLNAVNRRNRTYQAAQDTQQDFDAYYAALRNKARDQFRSGELEGLEFSTEGPEKTRLAAYLRLNAALGAEQAAVRQAINAETNTARRRFNQDLGRTARDVFLQLPGAQATLAQVRSVVGNLRSTVTNIRNASATQPMDALSNQLAEQVSGAAAAQNAVRNLGSLVGTETDRALGGALSQAQALTSDVTKDADKTLELLNALDSELSRYTFDQAQYSGGQLGGRGLDPQLVERATAAVDVASQALAVLAAMQSTGGMTQEQLYAQIRAELLEQRNAGLSNAAMNVSAVVCKEVFAGEYEAVAGFLGEAVPADTDGAKFYVCYDRESGEPLSAWVGRVEMAMPEPAAEEPQTEAIPGDLLEADSGPDPTSTPERWTLAQADAAPFVTFSLGEQDIRKDVANDFCHIDLLVTNSHPTYDVRLECESYDLGIGTRVFRFYDVGPGETKNFYHSYRQSFRGQLSNETYAVRCVAHLSSSEARIDPRIFWLIDEYRQEGSLLASGLTLVVPPHPCAH